MAYALRYYKEIAQTDGGVVRLEIHKKDSTTSAVEIGAVVQGLSLEIQGQQDDIDTPIQKTSLHMTFVDASDIENGQKNGFWEEFYTPDALLWRVVLKAKDAGETSFRTIWGGYVTPDSFSEDLVYRGSVSITARDNIGHMQDFPFDALGDADGLISLFNLVSMGWEKIQSPMDLSWNGLDWLSCNDVIAYHTLMNVSQFKDMNWYKAIETALASYGAVMRYAGENEVYVTTLRYMPSLGRNIDLMDRIDPTFIAGAQRELVPAVKRIEESVDYDLQEEIAEQVSPSDYTGDIETYTLVGNSVDKDGVAYPINNKVSGQGWCNPDSSLFFNPQYYQFAYDKDGDAKYMWLAANNYQYEDVIGKRYAEYSKRVLADNLRFNISFGSPYAFRGDGSLLQFNTITTCTMVVMAEQNGVTEYLNDKFEWTTEATKFEVDASAGVSVPINLESYDGMVLLRVQIHQIRTTTDRYVGQRFVPVYSAGLSCNKSLREKNTVNTVYNADNNVILSRDPEIGPAFDKVALPAFIKNGIFYRNGDEILPARLWSWGGSEQQMAVWNHLQLLCYYAKPNNLISGTIVNADITRVAAIYEWNHAEHILVSGRYNFLNGHIEGAVLREFARYEDMWSEVAGAAMPETEQDSRSNVEGGASSSASASTYTATQNVNIGTGGGGGGTGASNLNDLLDVDTTGVVAQSVLYYNGTSWVDMSFASLVNPLLNPYLKAEVASSTYATKDALNGVETAVSANATAIAGLDTRMTNAENAIGLRYTKQETNNLLAKYLLLESTNQTIKGNITIEGNLIVRGDTSSTAKGTDAGVAGTLLGIKVNGTTYDKPVNGILTIPDYPTSLEWSAINGKPTKLTEFTNDAGFITSAALNGYAKTSDLPTKSSLGLANVENKSSATIRGEITSANVTNALGYTPLSTAGGEISSDSYVPLILNSTNAQCRIQFRVNKTDKALVGYNASYGAWLYDYASGAYLGVKDDGTPHYNGNTLYHTGNFNPANYLPLSGGTISGTTTDPIIVNTSTESVGIRLQINKANKAYVGYGSSVGAYLYNYDTGAYIGVDNSGSPFYHNGTIKNTLIHSGNIGSQSVASATNLAGTYIKTDQSNVNNAYIQIKNADGKSSFIQILQAGTLCLGSSYSHFVIKQNGNVGVGFSDPQYKLDVAGNVGIGTTSVCNLILRREGVNYITAANALYLTTSGSITALALFADGTAQFGKAVTMLNELFLGNNMGLYFKNASGTNVLAMYVSPSNVLQVGYNNVDSVAFQKPVTMSSTLSVTLGVTSTKFLTNGNYGIWRGSSYTSAMTANDIAFYADNFRFDCGSNFVKTLEIKERLVTISGNAIITGDTSSGSDIRFKDKLSDHRIALSDIASAPLFTFTWNDREDDTIHLGSSAQYWEKVAPWLVKGEDFKTLDYSTLGVAIGISLANKTLNLEDRVKMLEKENKALKEQIRRIQYGS